MLLLQKIYFTDIETVPMYPNIAAAPERLQLLFQKRFARFKTEDNTWNDIWLQHAGLYAEFNKIVSIALGVIIRPKDLKAHKLKIKVYRGDDEKQLLTEFGAALEAGQPMKMCTHNGLEFDFPILMRAYIKHRIKLPKILNVAGKKTWEVDLMDTQAMWSGTQWRHMASMDLLACLFGIPSPKDDMDGSMVSAVYYSDQPDRLERIARYNALDVYVNVNVYIYMRQDIEMIADENIEVIL